MVFIPSGSQPKPCIRSTRPSYLPCAQCISFCLVCTTEYCLMYDKNRDEFPYYAVSSLVGSYFFLSTLLSDTVCLCSSLNGKESRQNCNSVYVSSGGSGSSVGIATDYGLDGPGLNTGEDEIFRPSRPALGPAQPPVKWVPGLSQG